MLDYDQPQNLTRLHTTDNPFIRNVDLVNIWISDNFFLNCYTPLKVLKSVTRDPWFDDSKEGRAARKECRKYVSGEEPFGHLTFSEFAELVYIGSGRHMKLSLDPTGHAFTRHS